VSEMKQRFASQFLFPSPRRPKIPMDPPKNLWPGIVDFAGLPEAFHIHDLRHTFASMGISHAFTLEQVGAVLGHSKAATTELYAHLLADPRRQVADDIATRLALAMKG
jgi:site-specific recombinase XerD